MHIRTAAKDITRTRKLVITLATAFLIVALAFVPIYAHEGHNHGTKEVANSADEHGHENDTTTYPEGSSEGADTAQAVDNVEGVAVEGASTDEPAEQKTNQTGLLVVGAGTLGVIAGGTYLMTQKANRSSSPRKKKK